MYGRKFREGEKAQIRQTSHSYPFDIAQSNFRKWSGRTSVASAARVVSVYFGTMDYSARCAGPYPQFASILGTNPAAAK